ncbi:MAG: SDR family oxidoreductase [Fimbriimonadaceae bacterium]
MARKRIIVTGGSRGIGRAIALELGRQGWDVAIQYHTDSRSAARTASLLGRSASGVYAADLAHPDQAVELVAAARADGPVHALVNNAGVYLPLDFAGSGDEVFDTNWSKTFAINFESPVRLIRSVLPGFLQSGGGKILNVGSRVGFRGEAGASLYAASKAALINLTRSLAVELAPKNVQLFGIAPGWVDTAMSRGGMEDRLPTILEGIPLGRMASPEDCAAAAAFLLSEKAEYLSGVVVDINGASYFH